MRIIKPSFEILTHRAEEGMIRQTEQAARTCYKSEDKVKIGSGYNLVKSLIKRGHHTPLEHISVSVKIICDRGVMAEITRHRLCAFSIESTRYANYSKDKFGKEITVIQPFFFKPGTESYARWENSCQHSEWDYLVLLKYGATPQEARSVLPNSLKTEIVMTANLREWMHIFKLRCSPKSHPQMNEIMIPLRDEFISRWPCFFEDCGS